MEEEDKERINYLIHGFSLISPRRSRLPSKRLFILNSSFQVPLDEIYKNEDLEVYLINVDFSLVVLQNISEVLSLYIETDNYILTDLDTYKSITTENRIWRNYFINSFILGEQSDTKLHYVNNSNFQNLFLEYVFKKNKSNKNYKPKEWCGDLNGIQDCIIIGGGVTGILLAKELQSTARSVLILEKTNDIGGLWTSYANNDDTSYSISPLFSIKSKKAILKYKTSKNEIKEDLINIVRRFPKHVKLMTNSLVKSVQKGDDETEIISFSKDGNEHKVKSKKIFVCINDEIKIYNNPILENEHLFEGIVYNGFFNETREVKWGKKKVLVIGSGANAVSLAEKALVKGAHSVTILSKNKTIVSPEILEYIQNIRPIDSDFKFSNKGNQYISNTLRSLCRTANVEYENEKAFSSTSDIWYIGHYYGLINVLHGDLVDIHSRHVVTDKGNKIDCDIIIKSCDECHTCGNAVIELLDEEHISENCVVRKNVMVINDNMFFRKNLSSYKLTLNLILAYIKRTLSKDQSFEKMGNALHLRDLKKYSIDDFILKNSESIDPQTLILDTMITMHDRYNPAQFLSYNHEKWNRICQTLKVRSLNSRSSLAPYPYKDVLFQLCDEWFESNLVIGNLESLKSDENIYESNLLWLTKCRDSNTRQQIQSVKNENKENNENKRAKPIEKIEIQNIEIHEETQENIAIDAVLNSYDTYEYEHDISGCVLDGSGYDVSGYIINKLINFKNTAETLLPQEFTDEGNNKFEWNLQKDGAKYFSYAFWRICYTGKSLLRKYPSFDVPKFDLEFGAVMQTLYTRLCYDVTQQRTPYIIIGAVRQAILYHSILKTVSDNVSLTYSIYDCDCNHSFLPPIKLNFDQRVAMFDFHIYNDQVILNSNFDHTYFDVSTMFLFYKTVDDYLYNSGQSLPVPLTVMYNPTQYDTDYFTNLANTWIEQVANMILSSVSGIITTQSKLEISVNTLSIINQSLVSSNIILSDYKLLCFLYTLFLFEVYQHRMKETNTFCVIDGEFVRDAFGSNSLGNFIHWQGPDVVTVSDFKSKTLRELLQWWINGFSTFNKDDVRTPINDGTFRLVFQDWTFLNDLTTKVYHDSITVFPFGEHHIDCTNSNKITLNIIKTNNYYSLNIPVQCAGIDMKDCWDQVICSF